jgi:solute:Na+ symporter, SSS family
MGFTAIDYAILALYLIGITIFGTLFRKGQKTVRDYFVGKKEVHWLVLSLSIVATETSTLTFVGVPAIAYANYRFPELGGSFTYLQVVFGYVIARVIISLIFIPAYFKGDLLTAYKLLENRFGGATKNFAASLFLIMRALADGVRIFGASLIVGAVLGASLPDFPNLTMWSIIIVGVLTLIYTFQGGFTAVIWTDVIQIFIYTGGAIVAAYLILNLVPGGWTEIVAEGSAAGKFQLFSFDLNFSQPFTFWSGLLGGTFLTMASHGTDQMLVQRLLACKNQRDSQKALIFSGFVVLFQFALFLLIGTMLYAYYQNILPADSALRGANCLTATPPVCDQIFPKFIVETLPTGVSGLVIAAIFAAAMSTLSSSLNSLASSTALDFYKPLINPNAEDSTLLRLSRWFTIGWGVILILIAFMAQGWGSVFVVGLTIASLIYGTMLGAFLLGVLTKSANQTGVVAGMLASMGGMLLIRFYTTIAWTWYVLIGTVICLVVGYTVSRLFPNRTTDATE